MLSSVSFLRRDAWCRDSQWKKPISVHSKCRALMSRHEVRWGQGFAVVAAMGMTWRIRLTAGSGLQEVTRVSYAEKG